MSQTSPISASDLAALLAARLCHDLVSPISALGAALSVLDDERAEDMRDDAIELLRTGANQARAKLEFCRLAFGAGGSKPAVIDMSEIRRLADEMFKDSRPDLVWKTEATGLEKPAARVLMNLIWLAVDALPRGGTVTIEAVAGEGGARLSLVSEGKKVRLEDAYIKAMAGDRPEDGFDGRSVQPYYTGLIAREHGGRADVRVEEERAVLSALIAPMSDAAT
ncbi:histidine phosphotransferase ChpT [Marinicauda sp. Alg238-R41]|uniref:histidine phosphotransferase ChpT n=1 Tax=Marinicauda sp. Alg238-R41 TaxID=2993447 RepID=UPI0022E392AC|nr:histidine phosphotransferase family protein [Marinicauda sp. Alg238-R41]